MKKTPSLKVNGLLHFTSAQIPDDRGYLQEIFQEDRYRREHQIFGEWKQTNVSKSAKNTLRGLHLASFARLVNCLAGRTLHAVVDLRSWESTYMGVQMWELTEALGGQIYVPAHCAHGFFAIENATVLWLQQGVYNPEESNEQRIHPQDATLKKAGVIWPEGIKFIMSPEDANAPTWGAHYGT